MTGSQTTHHTTGTIFQPSFPGDKGTRLCEPYVDLLDQGKKDYGSYIIRKKRADPPAIPDFEDKFKDSPLIEEAFHRDVAWVLCGAVSKEMLLEIQPELDSSASWIMDKLHESCNRLYYKKVQTRIPSCYSSSST